MNIFPLTMNAIIDFIAAGVLFVGLAFMFFGAVGIIRLPDCYSKMHASSKCTTLGLTGMLLAACLHMADTIVVSKAAVTIVFTFVAMPIGSQPSQKSTTRWRALLVPPPIKTIGLCPVCWSLRSIMMPSSEPACRLGAVQSKPI